MAANRGVAYEGTGKVEVQNIDYPKMEHNGRKLEHAVILKLIATNICGSDQHMVRGRTTAPIGMILGHEITGEIIEKGSDVEFLEIGDLVSSPFNIACGRCRNCREGQTGICLNVNGDRPGGAFGYVDMGGWIGGQADYVMVPYADFNLLKFPDKEKAMAKIRDLALLSDIFPTGYHGAYTAGRKHWFDGVCCWSRAGWPGMCRGLPFAWSSRSDRRRPYSGSAGPGQELRLRDHRSAPGGRAGRQNCASSRGARSGFSGRLRRL